MQDLSIETLLAEIEELKEKLSEADQMIQAIKDGEVDAFAIGSDSVPEVYTLQTGDYAYRILIEEIGEGALNVTEEGLIVYTNKTFYQLIDLPYEKVIGTRVFDYIHADSCVRFKKLFDEALRGKSRGEIDLVANGAVVPVFISLTSLQPNLPTVGMIVSDLSEKKKSESTILQYQNSLEEKNTALLRTNEELASFAYVASHDLQEPLRKIQIFSTRILEKAGDGFAPDVADYLRRIMDGAKKMQNLIRALLQYSRLNISDVKFVPTDLNALVEEVKNSIMETIEENKATIVISALPEVAVVPHQMSQVFSNILLNSIKYKREGIDPLITISTLLVDADPALIPGLRKPQRFWQIRVADNGIGFEAAYAERIFEVFQRLHASSEYQGTGIGLAICRKIMQAHGGHITAEGKPGEGSVFNVYLPLNL
ncbi:MAG TPA: ATP-binding protein [Puia sp.]|nr:ATP-binding protein [Puia sp.]